MILDDMIEYALSAASDVLIGNAGAQLPPTFVIMFKTRPPMVMIEPWNNEQEKSRFLLALAGAMKAFRASIDGYVVISEAWVARQDHKPRPGDRPPSERDDRREVVFACASDGASKRFKAWAIERDADAVVVKLPEDDEMSKVDGLGGRMADLLEAAS